MYPFYVMALLFLFLAALALLDTSLVNLAVFSAFPSLRWLLVHIITLGALAEVVFGLAPTLVASLSRRPRPAIRWDTWIVLNAGLIILFAGIPMVHNVLITTGGTLVFIAVLMLLWALVELGAAPEGGKAGQAKEQPERERSGAVGPSFKFYITGLVYLLVGIIVGTGLWLGWAEPLRIVTPKEVHVHSNLWGFASFIFAGLLIDLFPSFTGRALAWPRSVTPIFWLMAVGALGLVTGPWVEENNFTVAGLVIHTVGTVWLLVIIVKPLLAKPREWEPGIWHLLVAYIWFLLAAVVAPAVVAGSSTGAEVAGSGGPILIFGWILQFGYALIPYLFVRGFQPRRPGRLGGTWFSLMTINAGGALYFTSLFLTTDPGALRGVAYIFWIISLIPILMELRGIIHAGSGRLEETALEELAVPE